MMLFDFLFAWLGLGVVLSSQSTVIQWGTCSETYNSTVKVDCGRLYVPLDYTESGGETLSLELFRAPAVKQPAKGSIVLNFGGPGIPGRPKLAEMAPILHVLSGGNYNLISFDPRGTGDTIPFRCFESELDRFAAAIDLVRSPRVHEKAALGRFWARCNVLAIKCAHRQNETGPLINTAFTARDVVSISEALGEDGFVRYWGFSYGTTLGATMVSMFPDKVDKILLDGVQNPHEYYHEYADLEEWSDSDEEFSHIFQHCIKNPDKCPLARDGATAAELEKSVWDLLERLKYHPLVLGERFLDRDTLSVTISNCLYSMYTWPDLTKALDMLINGNMDEDFLLHFLGLDTNPFRSFMALEQSVVGIHCVDRSARAGSLEDLMPTLEKLANVSRVLDGIPGGINVPCASWQIDPKERYKGNFQVRPRKPVLFIGNTWDGLTPIRSARNVSSGFEGSGLLEVNGYGHCSLGQPSSCSLKVMRTYWQEGTLPKPGTVCKVDAPPFSNVTWNNVLRNMEEDATHDFVTEL